jgi:hypothetical protein
MRYARVLSIGLVATVAFAGSAAAVENAHELAAYCQSLERGTKGAGRYIYIPRTREALTCWGYMRAMQDLSVLADENGHRIMGACPPEQTATLQLIRSFVRYARARRSELLGNAMWRCSERCERPTRAAMRTAAILSIVGIATEAVDNGVVP